MLKQNKKLLMGSILMTVGMAATHQAQAGNLALFGGKCKQPVGSLRIVEPENTTAWSSVGLSLPTRIIRVLVNDSKCFTVVDRGAAFDAAQLERNLASSGMLQSGQNIGAGQIRAADYVLVPDLLSQNANAGGTNLNAAGSQNAVWGKASAKASYSSHKKSAEVVLTLIDVRTSEQLASVSAEAKISDKMVALAAQGKGRGIDGQVGFSNWSNTEIGKVVQEAYGNAFKSLLKDADRKNLVNHQFSAPTAVQQVQYQPQQIVQPVYIQQPIYQQQVAPQYVEQQPQVQQAQVQQVSYQQQVAAPIVNQAVQNVQSAYMQQAAPQMQYQAAPVAVKQEPQYETGHIASPVVNALRYYHLSSPEEQAKLAAALNNMSPDAFGVFFKVLYMSPNRTFLASVARYPKHFEFAKKGVLKSMLTLPEKQRNALIAEYYNVIKNG